MTSFARIDIADKATSATKPLTSASFTLQLALFLVVNVAFINGLIWHFSPGGFDDTVLKQSWDMLRGVGGDDSWGPMAAALEHLAAWQPDGKPLYSAVFFEQGVKFQYPPSALFGLEAMMLFGEDRVRTYDEMAFPGLPPVNDLVGWAFMVMAAVCSAALLELGLRRSLASYGFDRFAIIRAALVFGFTLTFYPAIKAFTLGQIQLWINSAFALVMVLFVLRIRIASGVLMGAICLIKPHYGLVVLWGALNREWRFTAGCAAVGAVGLLFSISHYGWWNHLDYLRVLSFMSERGESYYANQSINGLLNRLASLFGTGSYANVTFDAYGFPPYTPWVYWGTVVSSALILLAAFLRRSSEQDRVLAFSIIAVSLTIASPIAWEHHYGVFLPVFAFIAGTLAGDRRKLAFLAICYTFVSNYVPLFNVLAETPFNVMQSYTFAGGLAFLILMHVSLSHHGRLSNQVTRFLSNGRTKI
ncbi:MAG: glycosyltransferase family 87 protein [Rhodomicrobiaceae bacterium]